MLKAFLARLKAEGWTQKEIADKTGLKQSFISLLSRGEKSPSVETVINLAKAFHVTTDEVLGLSPPKEPKPPTPRKPRNNSHSNTI